MYKERKKEYRKLCKGKREEKKKDGNGSRGVEDGRISVEGSE